ncbi:Membrane-bound O-acyltransferase [Actinidia chinensis var. chinensis]|uniref:Membrane-bound O-acyltransferase n=1 Tax=Actinidia chinensis var. chinensis TaxID=1590841 RepID=A0A2R6R164_ACTCC|nr:Membrane-bound O-acyltransferase [Actinidia chinensis var. chinensis]
MNNHSSWQRKELPFLTLYAIVFYVIIIRRSLQLSQDHHGKLYGLRPGWIGGWLNDVSDAQWRNFRGNLPVLTIVLGIFTSIANMLRVYYQLKAKGMSIVWLLISLAYLSYLHGACIIFVLLITSVNFLLVKSIGLIGMTFVVPLDGRSALILEGNGQNDSFSFSIYLCYLVYAPLYIAGPILSFNAFASQIDTPQKNYSLRQVAWYGLRWYISFFLMELMTHLFYYNAFAISGLWKQLSPMDVFIIGYGVLNFVWLKFFLIWQYFRFWSLISGIEAPENMPKCINNCYNLESFWKNWHASFNKWLVRYVYIPLGGSQRKLLNVWVIFTFVAIWHDLEWKLLAWAWLTCIFFVPEMIAKSAANAFQVRRAFGEFVFREVSAVAGAITITCLVVGLLSVHL